MVYAPECICPDEGLVEIVKDCAVRVEKPKVLFFTEDTELVLPLTVKASMDALIASIDIVRIDGVKVENSAIVAGEPVSESIDGYEKIRDMLASTFSCELIDLSPAQEAQIKNLVCNNQNKYLGFFFAGLDSKFYTKDDAGDKLPFIIEPNTLKFTDRNVDAGFGVPNKNMLSFQFLHANWNNVSQTAVTYSPFAL